ncbi:MAG: ORF6N domain-containing protein [Prosthecobacter sp.]|uniref:ORF6N domain-containing protein n=1 Tax=Prosthecobacter sp. TaxID=1965333 RepID=UPI0039028F99
MAAPKSIPVSIHIVRGQRVVLDSDLAALYGVETKVFNQAIKRNLRRFPEGFAFQLSGEEWLILKSQFVTSSLGHGGKRKLPWVFTEHGALMAASVLNSDRAISMSVYVIRAFIEIREQIAANAMILKRLAEIDNTLLIHDASLRDIYKKLMPLLAPPPPTPHKQIGFHP